MQEVLLINSREETIGGAAFGDAKPRYHMSLFGAALCPLGGHERPTQGLRSPAGLRDLCITLKLHLL